MNSVDAKALCSVGWVGEDVEEVLSSFKVLVCPCWDVGRVLQESDHLIAGPVHQWLGAVAQLWVLRSRWGGKS